MIGGEEGNNKNALRSGLGHSVGGHSRRTVEDEVRWGR